MAQLTNQQFEEKYNVLFRDNNIQNITEKTFRDFKTDLKDSYANLKALNVRQVKGATYPVPYTDSLNTIPAAYRILGMSALARNGQSASAALTNPPAPPITFTLVANSGGTISALTDEQPDTTTTVKAVWVRQSGTSTQVIDSFPPFVAQNPDGTAHPYEAGDKFKFIFDTGQARLFEVRQYQNVASNPLPTGKESDPNYRPFAPLYEAAPTGGPDGPAFDYQDVPDDVRNEVVSSPFNEDTNELTTKLTGSLLDACVRGMYFKDQNGTLYIYMFANDGYPNWCRVRNFKLISSDNEDLSNYATHTEVADAINAVRGGRFRGPAASILPNTDIAKYDTVSYNGALYYAIDAYTTGDTFDGSRYTLLFTASTGGNSGGPIYTPGNNIKISADNVISANIPTYSPGEGIEISDTNVISAPSIFDEDQIDAIVGSNSPNYSNPFATKQTVPFSFYGDPADYNIVMGYKGVPERFGWADNIIGTGFKRNIIATYFGGNIIGTNVRQNTFGDNFLNNKLGDSATSNVFYYYVTNNTFGSNLVGCFIFGLEHTTIGNNCSRIFTIGQTGYLNIGDNCSNLLFINCDNPGSVLVVPPGTRNATYVNGALVSLANDQYNPTGITEAQRLAIASPKLGMHVYQLAGGTTPEGVWVAKSTGWQFGY
jgi:hypothetical protein